LMIVLFSIAAVWVSALIPARRIGKTGAISSIRGNESTVGKKFRHNRLMGAASARMLKRGKCLNLLSDASVKRSRFLSRGIIRSMVIFVSLTLIVSFGVRTINDILELKSSDSTYSLGKDYEGYEYAITTSDAEKYSYMKDYLLGSKDVTKAKESRVLGAISVRKKYLSDEYIKGVKEIVAKFRPDGVSEEEASYLYGDEMDCSLWMLILTDEEYLELAKKAGADMSIVTNRETPSLLMYDKATITTDSYRYGFRDAAQADYAIYSLKDPVNVKVGETLEIDSYSHNPDESNELFSGEAVFAGYVSEEDLASLYKVDDGELWAITTMPSALKLLGAEEEELDKFYFYYTALLFNVTDDDCDAMKVLDSNSDPEDPIYFPAALMFGISSFKGVIAKILRIVSVCFILLIMAICTLNLYNSVMGRCIERRGELAVLRSVGMTQSQMTRMLHLENAKLFAGSLGWSALISAVFVFFLHKMAEHMIGRMTFSFPYVIIIGVCVLEIVLLTVMTMICYGRDKTSIMERIRDESISG
ncbi:MAG: ABC transporter permease, partial [Lachnospiraceae bacterium]|nr:ABC transporter permease [Lachnospiraceae bacterium]